MVQKKKERFKKSRAHLTIIQFLRNVLIEKANKKGQTKRIGKNLQNCKEVDTYRLQEQRLTGGCFRPASLKKSPGNYTSPFLVKPVIEDCVTAPR
jgi:hypothetical protein